VAIPVDEPSKFQVLSASTDSGFSIRVYKDVSQVFTPLLSLSYHGLGADTVGAVNPDIFGHNFAMLWEIHVLLQLHARDKVSQHPQSEKRVKKGLVKTYVCSI
jgi:hypothetical protein